ncbi:MAG: hypothetical protein JNM89_12610 [Hyphomicrobiaceae bacterium]|nr:hypothetical protein [Hyphomicrobiaceae bacterium]
MPEKLSSSDLHAELAKANAWSLAPVETAPDLARNLGGVYTTLRTLDLGRYDPHQLAEDAPVLIDSLFKTRMALRDRVAEWRNKGLLGSEVQTAIRNLLRITRYGGDMLGEMAMDFRRLPSTGHTQMAFTGRSNNTLINPRFDIGSDLAFKSGDVILVRGRAHNSAAIARIGDVDSQYSHVGIVYVDPAGKHWMIEVLIEKGGVIVPLKDALQHGLGRAILFRHRDPVLAHNAGYIAHEHVRHSLSHYGKPIRYDFTMKMESYKQMFCSKLIRFAYEKASEGEIKLSTFETRLDMKNIDFFDRIGVLANSTFAPGDMELEPDFDVVAEWQDYRVTSDLRLQDMVMDKLLEWMETRRYKFKETLAIHLIALLGRFSTYLSPGIKNMVADSIPEVPAHMPRRTIATIVMLHKTAEPIVEELRALETERNGRFHFPLHPSEVLEWLERYRERSGGVVGYLSA